MGTDRDSVCMGGGGHFIVVQLGNGTVRRTVTMTGPLLFSSGLVRFEAVLHSCLTSPEEDRYPLMTLNTHGDFIVLPHWNTWPLAPCPAIPLTHINLILSEPDLALS